VQFRNLRRTWLIKHSQIWDPQLGFYSSSWTRPDRDTRHTRTIDEPFHQVVNLGVNNHDLTVSYVPLLNDLSHTPCNIKSSGWRFLLYIWISINLLDIWARDHDYSAICGTGRGGPKSTILPYLILIFFGYCSGWLGQDNISLMHNLLFFFCLNVDESLFGCSATGTWIRITWEMGIVSRHKAAPPTASHVGAAGPPSASAFEIAQKPREISSLAAKSSLRSTTKLLDDRVNGC